MSTLLAQFASDTKISTRLAYCQIIHPPNLPTKALEKGGYPFGLFLSLEGAEQTEFKPDANWTKTEVDFAENTVKGYITSTPRFVVVQSGDVEIEGIVNDRWENLGPAYSNGMPTALKKLKDQNPEEYRICRRYLLLFLNQNNEFLHISPIRFTGRGGFGADLSSHIQQSNQGFSKVYCKLAEQQGISILGNALTEFALAHTVLDLQIGYTRTDPQKSPFACIAQRLAPEIDQVGQAKEVAQNGGQRTTRLVGTALEALVVNKESQTGKLIDRWFHEFQDFGQSRFEALEDAGLSVLSRSEKELDCVLAS